MEPLYFRRGFTLIELLVVLAIIVTLMTIVFTSQSSFNKTLVLANTAYDIALTLRSAESFGLSSRASGSTANVGYGVHFQAETTGSFIFFADTDPPVGGGGLCHPIIGDPTGPGATPGDCVYTSSSDYKVNDYTLGNGIYVKDFCAYSGSWSCASTGLISLDIVFAQPNPTPSISTNGSYSAALTKACLVLASPSAPGGPYRYVSVESSGQITANASSCGS